MGASKQNTNFWQKLFKSKLFFLATLIPLVLVSVALIKIVYKRYQIQQEISQIQQEITELSGENKRLSELVRYLDTEAFREKMARQKLNLQREGETVASVPLKEKSSAFYADKKVLDSNQNLTINGKEDKRSNPQKWWKYFFTQ